MEKTLTIKMSEKEHREIKVLSAEEGKSIKDFVMDLIKMYIRQKEKIEIENLSYDELSDEEKHIIDMTKEEYSKGECIDIDTFLEEIKNED
ncbi:MAG: hypothetical protein ABRQ39_04790 [Candidatus Eremiobacterota bacterium]